MVDSPPGGNNNGRFDPGEEAELIVSLRNVGTEQASNVEGVLRSGHPLFTILDSSSSFGDIPAGSTRTNAGDRFTARVDQSVPIETPVPCTLLLSADTDYADTLIVLVVIGELRTGDPIPDGPRRPALYYAYDDTDSAYAEHPVFEWIDISGVGTRLTLSDDQTVQVSLPSGFGPFVFYDASYSQVSICGNGWVAPGYTAKRSYTNTQLPAASEASMLAIVWDDLYPPSGNGVYWHHDVANHRFIIQYDSMPYYSNRNVFDWYQIVIYDTTLAAEDGNSVFTYQYLTAAGYSSCTVGEQDSIRQVAIQTFYDGTLHRGSAPLEAGRAIRFTTNGPTTGVSEPGHPGAGMLALRLQSTPSPVRRNSTIRWHLPRPGHVRLSIYDVNGRVLRTLTDTDLAAGNHSACWDGRNQDGQQVPNGIYLFAIDTPFGSATTKAVVLR